MWALSASFRVCPCRSRFIRRTNADAKRHTPIQHNNDDCEWELISTASTSAGLGPGTVQQDDPNARPQEGSAAQSSNEKTKAPDSKVDPDRQPCLGEHVPVHRSNQHASWTTCARCSLRLSYKPALKQTSQGQMAEVAETICQLQVQCQAVTATAELLSTNITHIRNEQCTSRKKKKAFEGK